VAQRFVMAVCPDSGPAVHAWPPTLGAVFDRTAELADRCRVASFLAAQLRRTVGRAGNRPSAQDSTP
jgi:hypothetical protein